LLIQLGDAEASSHSYLIKTRPWPKPSFPTLVQSDTAKLENLAKSVPQGDRLQVFGLSVDPLYVFVCGILWHQHRHAGAGWDLIQFSRSPDMDVRAMAADLLAKTDRSPRRARVTKSATRDVASPDGQGPSKVAEMNTPYGLEIVENVWPASCERIIGSVVSLPMF
jgi:hypothetical protein